MPKLYLKYIISLVYKYTLKTSQKKKKINFQFYNTNLVNGLESMHGLLGRVWTNLKRVLLPLSTTP